MAVKNADATKPVATRISELIVAGDALIGEIQTLRTHPTIDSLRRVARTLSSMSMATTVLALDLIGEEGGGDA